MEGNDFNKIRQSILQLASVDVSHIYLLNDFNDFTVRSNKHKGEQTDGWSDETQMASQITLWGNFMCYSFFYFFLILCFRAS